MPKLITDRDTNTTYFSEWVKELPCFSTIVDILDRQRANYSLLPYTDDYWVRDYMPIQVSDLKFVQYQYNPDYLQNEKVYITDPTFCCTHLGIETIQTDIIIDGGNVIKCNDCIIMTDKIFSENKDHKRIQLINKLEDLFETEIVFIPCDKDERYGHADGMARYVDGKKVLINNYIDFDKVLRRRLINALNPYFDIIELHYDEPKQSDFSWAYINFLQVGTLILLPTLGIREDEKAYAQFQEIYKGYCIEQVNVIDIAKMGGALHCISWNIKTYK